jgi:hypothetical protein
MSYHAGNRGELGREEGEEGTRKTATTTKKSKR